MKLNRALLPVIAALAIAGCSAPSPAPPSSAPPTQTATETRFITAVRQDGRNANTPDDVALRYGYAHCGLRTSGTSLVESRKTLEQSKAPPSTRDLTRIMAAAEVILCPEVKGK